MKSNLCSSLSRGRGLTLIEVVAGLALMSSILVAVLFLKSRYARQQALADHHLQSLAAADALLSAWWQTPAKFPRQGSGSIGSQPTLGWRTKPLPNSELTRLGCQIIRLEITDQSSSALGASDVVAVDVLLPTEGEKHE